MTDHRFLPTGGSMIRIGSSRSIAMGDVDDDIDWFWH